MYGGRPQQSDGLAREALWVSGGVSHRGGTPLCKDLTREPTEARRPSGFLFFLY